MRINSNIAEHGRDIDATNRKESCAMTKLSKTLTVLAAAATLGLATFAAPQPAQARCVGCAVGAGIIGGLAAGAIIGSAIAPGPYYGPGYYYGPGPVYYRPGCYWTRQRVWTEWGWRLRRVRVCG